MNPITKSRVHYIDMAMPHVSEREQRANNAGKANSHQLMLQVTSTLNTIMCFKYLWVSTSVTEVQCHSQHDRFRT